MRTIFCAIVFHCDGALRGCVEERVMRGLYTPPKCGLLWTHQNPQFLLVFTGEPTSISFVFLLHKTKQAHIQQIYLETNKLLRIFCAALSHTDAWTSPAMMPWSKTVLQQLLATISTPRFPTSGCYIRKRHHEEKNDY